MDKVEFRELFDNMSSGVAVYEATKNGDDFIIKDMNRAGERISQVQKAEVVGKSVLETFPGVKEYGLLAVLRQVWQTGQPQHHPVSQYQDDRLSHWAENYVYRLPSGNIVAVYDDVTGRKQAEEDIKRYQDHLEQLVEERTAALKQEIAERKQVEASLRKSEAKHRSLTEDVLGSTAVGIFILNADFQVVWVNQALERYFGLCKEEVIGRDKRQLIRGRIKNIFEEPEQFVKTVFATYDDNRYVEQFECHVLPNSECRERWLEHRSQPIRSGLYAGGRVELYYDVTDRKRAEAALKEYSERLEEMVEERTKELQEAQEQLVRREKLAVLGQLAGGIAHGLRNPLANIKTSAYFLSLVLAEPEPEVKESIAILDKEVDIADRIITSLLDFARTKTPVQQHVQVNQLLWKTLSRITIPDNQNIEIVYKPNESLPIILTDPEQLDQVFDNLIHNAIQAMPEGGQLDIKSEQLNTEWIVVSITDTGVGIPKENMARLFEPLFTTKTKGIGLGLALVKTLVEANGGDVEVESRLGQGSTFIVRLPLTGTTSNQ